MSFKDKLKEKRLEANLTQVQLAEKVSVKSICDTENHPEL